MEDKTTLENAVRKEILIVDDGETNRMLLSSILGYDYDIREACNGKHALEEIEKKMPDLVLSDVDMPLMNGFGFLEKIKDDEKYKTLKVIINSGGGYDFNDFKKYRNVVKFMAKPYGLTELKEAIEKVLYDSK